MSTRRLPRLRIPGLAVVLTLVAVVITAGAPEPIALVSGVTGTGTALVRRGSGKSEPLTAGVRLLPGDFLDARGGSVTVTLFDLRNNGLVTLPMVADSPVEATAALTAEKPTLLGGFWSGLKSLVAGDATSAQRFGGAMAGQTSEPAPSESLSDKSITRFGLRRQELAARPAAATPGRSDLKAEATLGGPDREQEFRSTGDSLGSNESTVTFREASGGGPGGAPTLSYGDADQTLGDEVDAAKDDGEPAADADPEPPLPQAASALPSSPPPPPAPATSDTFKSKSTPALSAQGPVAPFELPERSGHLVPRGVVELVLHPKPRMQALTLYVSRELPTRKVLLKRTIPIGRESDGRPRAVATLDLVGMGVAAGDILRFRVHDSLGRFAANRWYAVGTPEDVQRLHHLIARARSQSAPPARQALLLLAAEAAVALNAVTTAREIYDELVSRPDLSDQDRKAFGSASAFLRGAAKSSGR